LVVTPPVQSFGLDHDVLDRRHGRPVIINRWADENASQISFFQHAEGLSHGS
jgi:hypothetical protein